MNTKLKSILKTITLSLGALLLVTTATYAIGTLTPSGTAGDDTQYTLNDIYSKLTDFTDGATAGTGTSTIPGTITASFNTLSEIYALLEAEDSDLVAGNIADGTTIFGVTGTLEEGVVYPTQWSTQNPAGYVTWQAAMDYCNYLEEDGSTVNVAVQNIWRLPTYIELVNASFTGVSFMGDWFWSSDISSWNNNFAYYVVVNDGAVSGYALKTSENLVRCTR